MLNEETKPLATEYLVREFSKPPQVKKISLVQSESEGVLDLVISIKTEDPGKLLQERGRLALESLKAERDLHVDVRIAVLEAGTNTYLGHLNVAGASPAVSPVEGYRFDPSRSRALFRNPPKKAKEKKKKIEKFDPLWAQAKKVCRLNQEEIRMAKELGFGPRTLMRNNPSPKQRWKLPVNLWIRELYEKRHPGKGFPPEPPIQPDPPLSPEEEELERQRFEEQMYWEDYRERNEIGVPKKKKKNAPKGLPAQVIPVKAKAPAPEVSLDELFLDPVVTDDDIPF